MEIKNWAIIAALALNSCAEKVEPPKPLPVMSEVERHRLYLAQERQLIQSYIEDHKLEGIAPNGYGMFELPIFEGEGPEAELSDRVVYEATVYLLDDTGVGRYTDTIELGYSQIEVGLHTAIEGMKKGDVKLVLIPSFLAHGIAGNLESVPPQSPLRYDLKIIQVIR